MTEKAKDFPFLNTQDGLHYKDEKPEHMANEVGAGGGGSAECEAGWAAMTGSETEEIFGRHERVV